MQCNSDLNYLHPGRRVILKSYQCLLKAPLTTCAELNYWLLIGCKASVIASPVINENNDWALIIRVDADFDSMGLVNSAVGINCLLVSPQDLKFVCRS
jgi:hypothetical protein